ncbi:MAG: hypothetical protein P4L55_00405 [Syntrophobacteraceae bacterium]|nr:hypothetical protein [Syntrophobacteraceae bacterium]
MKIKTAWAIQSLALCVLFNLVFTVVIFYMASGLIDASHQWVSALGASAPAMPADVHKALDGLHTLIVQTRGWLIPVLSVLCTAFTLLLWFFIFGLGCRQIRRSELESQKPEVHSVTPDVGPPQSEGIETAQCECATENG